MITPPHNEDYLKEFDWREVDAAIMDFQMHVRKETGGNDYAVVDSTELKQAINNALTRIATEQRQKGREEGFQEVNVRAQYQLCNLRRPS